jgi:hypothetical protein
VSETCSTAIGIETLSVELDVGINMSASYFKKGSLVTIPIKFRHNDTSLTRLIKETSIKPNIIISAES